MARTFSTHDAAAITDVSYRQLDYWARTDLIRPSLGDARGSGSRRRYSYDDVVRITIIRILLDAGHRLERVRDIFDYFVIRERPLIRTDSVIVDEDGVSVIDTVDVAAHIHRCERGVYCLPLAAVIDDVDRRLLELVA